MSTLCVGVQATHDDLSASADKATICVVPGFGGCSHSYATLSKALHRLGHRVVCINPTRAVGEYKSAIGPWPLVMHAEHNLRVLKELGIKRAFVLGHSMGAAVGTAMRALDPERIQRTIGLCPAGICKDSLLLLAMRLLRKHHAEVRRIKRLSDREFELAELAEGALANARNYVMANRILALNEAMALTGLCTLGMVSDLEHPEVHLIAGEQDTLFSPPRIKRAVLRAGQVQRIPVLSALIGHDPQYDPNQIPEVMRVITENELLTPWQTPEKTQ